VFPGGEIGDMCEDPIGPSQQAPQNWFTATAGGKSYLVQRMWSVNAAALGGDPCSPIGPNATPYFNVAVDPGAATLQLAVGASATFPATAFSSGPITSWTVLGLDYSSRSTGVATSVTVTPSQTSVTNGDAITITVTLDSMPQTEIAQGVYGTSFLIVSAAQVGGNNLIRVWPGLVIAQ
jgi:hypothetical protein